ESFYESNPVSYRLFRRIIFLLSYAHVSPLNCQNESRLHMPLEFELSHSGGEVGECQNFSKHLFHISQIQKHLNLHYSILQCFSNTLNLKRTSFLWSIYIKSLLG
ncbi:hypothetical protein L9F63_023793, partial [Diploptera punctata]